MKIQDDNIFTYIIWNFTLERQYERILVANGYRVSVTVNYDYPKYFNTIRIHFHQSEDLTAFVLKFANEDEISDWIHSIHSSAKLI